MASELSDSLRRHVADRAYHVCEYCLIHEDDTFWGCQVDHIISRKHGGDDKATNLAWACACCNNSKGSDLGTLAGARSELTRLFHPRSDRWADLFQLHGININPLHAIGEATVKLLQMNEPQPPS
jgi:5-methylcytosine-specific restriction endonuclease McrA